MANFLQIRELRKRYGYNNYKNRYNLKNVEVEAIIKYFNNKPLLVEAFRKGLSPEIIPYLEEQKEAHVVNIFIDITSFSTKIQGFTNNQLSQYLDQYYDKVIPLIYKNGGEVDKIIGDGIIAVFGHPFLNEDLDKLLEKADRCSKEIIVTLDNSAWEAKVALHDGKIKYYKNKSVNYPEYTMIGQPITDLFRLESVSSNNALNYYIGTSYSNKFNFNCVFTYTIDRVSIWGKGEKQPVSLKGVSYEFICKYSEVTEDCKYIDNYPITASVERIKSLFKNPKKLNEVKDFQKISDLAEKSYCSFSSTIISFRFSNYSTNLRKEDLTYFNSFIHVTLEEVTALLASLDSCRKVEIIDNEVLAYYNSPYKIDILGCFDVSMKVNGFIQMINEKIKPTEANTLHFRIGIDYGTVYSHAVNQTNNLLVISGSPVQKARELSKLNHLLYNNSSFIKITDVVYNNIIFIKPKYKDYFSRDNKLGCWQSSYYKTIFKEFLGK